MNYGIIAAGKGERLATEGILLPKPLVAFICRGRRDGTCIHQCHRRDLSALKFGSLAVREVSGGMATVLLAVLPPLILKQSFAVWIERALTFLVVSCPCALVISVPLTFFGGIGGASKAGVLIKGANYMEALSTVDTVVFDKTGTLTKGIFSVSAVHPQNRSSFNT